MAFRVEESRLRIGIQTWGSAGDIRPLIALAGGLRGAGHDVTLAATSLQNRDYSDLCGAVNVEYNRVPDHVDCDLSALREAFTTSSNSNRRLKLLLDRAFFPFVDDMCEAATMLCDTNDLVIGHFAVYPLKVAAMKRGKPFASVTFWRGLIPTAYLPPGGLPNLGRMLNPLQWKLVQTRIDGGLKKDIGRLWLREGLPKLKHVLPEAWHSDSLNLVAISPVFCQQQPDWTPEHRVCGFLRLPDPAEPWEMPEGLCDFLNAGERPVYMTLGAVQELAPEQCMETMLEAAGEAGCRALIQTNSQHYPANSRDGGDRVYFMGRTPHHQIFRHCAAVVHHGGAGTTHSATWAGLPSVVVAYGHERLCWGTDLARLGLGAKPLPIAEATPSKLARRIRNVLDSPPIRRRATELGEAMRRENGVARAVELVEDLASSCGLP
ncbi:MAG: glycosyltransferase [Kiritimatiellia bacterium]|jgi:UDP:flavonoid glycosyltransferase YjiC (YdhE family)|nr:glycosyltransferase [Kiritimatiellia bacterium]